MKTFQQLNTERKQAHIFIYTGIFFHQNSKALPSKQH